MPILIDTWWCVVAHVVVLYILLLKTCDRYIVAYMILYNDSGGLSEAVLLLLFLVRFCSENSEVVYIFMIIFSSL